MTRKKVKLAWIVSDTARKASMRKRKQGLLKKVRELTILCGVNGFVVIYGFDNERPSVWPSRGAVAQLVERYNETPDTDRGKKTTTQESYLKERIAKVQDQLRKQNKKNQQLVADHIMFQLSRGTQLHELKTDDLICLFWVTEEKIKQVHKKIEYFKQVPELPPPPPPRCSVSGNRAVVEPPKLTETVLSDMDEWFINMMMNNSNMPGSSASSIFGGNASVFGGNASVFGGTACEGLAINSRTEAGFSNQDGFDFYNWVETTMQFPQQVSNCNGDQQMNEVNFYQPQENYNINQLGELVNEGLEGAAVGGGFPMPESENNGDEGMGGNDVAMELPHEQDNMDFLMDNDGSETSLILQKLYEEIKDDGGDLTFSTDFGYSWDKLFSP